jgi:hypothetical protein
VRSVCRAVCVPCGMRLGYGMCRGIRVVSASSYKRLMLPVSKRKEGVLLIKVKFVLERCGCLS